MPSLTTKYDKIGDERKKVFVLRGDEVYARTVDVALDYTIKNTGANIQGYLVKFDATVFRNLGDSVLLLYDGDTLLSQIDTHDYLQEYSFDNIRLGWGEEHKVYAKYKANKQTLGKKSKPISISSEIPSTYIPVITISGYTQIMETDNYTVNGTVTFMGDTVEDDTPINVYLDGEFVDTVYTEYGTFTCDVGALTTGKHTITAETINSSSMNAKSQNKTLLVGYDIQFLEYPQKLIQGFANQFRVSVKNWNGATINPSSIRFNGVSYPFNAQGIAEFTLSTITTGDYYATFGNSRSETVHITLYDATVDVVSTQKYVAKNHSMPVKVYVDNGEGLKIGVYNVGLSDTYITDIKVGSDNTATFYYGANGAGERTLKFVNGNSETTYSFIDTIMHRGEGRTYNMISNGFNGGKYEETTTGCRLILPSRESEIKFRPSPQISGENNINVIEFKVKKFQPSTLQDISGNVELKFNNSSTVLNLTPSDLASGKTIKVRIHDGVMTQYIQRTSDVVEIDTTLEETPSTVKSWTLTNNMLQENTSLNIELEYLIFYHK